MSIPPSLLVLPQVSVLEIIVIQQSRTNPELILSFLINLRIIAEEPDMAGHVALLNKNIHATNTVLKSRGTSKSEMQEKNQKIKCLLYFYIFIHILYRQSLLTHGMCMTAI